MSSLADCGLVVGHATDAGGATGCTVIRGASDPFACAVFVPGRATATGKIGGAATAMKGGLGSGEARAGTLVVRALAVVNALGDVRGASGAIVAGARASGGGWLDTAAWIADGRNDRSRFADLAGRSTTL